MLDPPWCSQEAVANLAEGVGYQRLTLLGEGSFGTAWCARRGPMEVVLKIQVQEQDFEREVKALRTIRDANVVSIFDAAWIEVPDNAPVDSISADVLYLI